MIIYLIFLRRSRKNVYTSFLEHFEPLIESIFGPKSIPDRDILKISVFQNRKDFMKTVQIFLNSVPVEGDVDSLPI